MELNETKRTFSLSSIHKNFQIHTGVENGCYVYTAQSHQCNSRNISEYDLSKVFHDSILEYRTFTHQKQWNTWHSTKQFHKTRPVCVNLTLLPKINEVSKRKNPNNTNNWDHCFNALNKTWKYIVCSLKQKPIKSKKKQKQFKYLFR
jgi:hypothetical protein